MSVVWMRSGLARAGKPAVSCAMILPPCACCVIVALRSEAKRSRLLDHAHNDDQQIQGGAPVFLWEHSAMWWRCRMGQFSDYARFRGSGFRSSCKP